MAAKYVEFCLVLIYVSDYNAIFAMSKTPQLPNGTKQPTRFVEKFAHFIRWFMDAVSPFFEQGKKVLTVDALIVEAKKICELMDNIPQPDLYGVTDGKAIGTKIEHRFQAYLSERYEFSSGSSAKGLDLPSVSTDIKTTSITQPQSSCPFKDSKQKIFGLGYSLIVFVYEKIDDNETQTGILRFVSCSFIDAKRTADYQTTTGIRAIIDNKGNEDDIFAFLNDKNIPADEVTLANLAKDILKNPPEIGYLTISNALQWRLQYGRIVNLKETVDGITTII